MGLKTDWIRYGAEGHVGYLCVPERAAHPLPAVLVLQEAWGVCPHIQEVTRRFALAGYAALAPDLYTTNGERPPALANDRVAELLAFLNAAPAAMMDQGVRDAELAGRSEAERARIVESLGAVRARLGNVPSFLPMVVDAARWLRGQCSATAIAGGQKVASVGFCMGGSLSGLLACHDPELAAAVVFYGSPPPLDLASRVNCPVLGLYGSLDRRLTAQLPAFAEAMKHAGKRFEPVVYDGAQHAFFNDSRPAYDVDASRDAFVRTLALLRSELTA